MKGNDLKTVFAFSLTILPVMSRMGLPSFIAPSIFLLKLVILRTSMDVISG